MFLHVNNGNCQKCREIIARYPGFYPPLLKWFTTLQKNIPYAHTSCAGRGQLDQEACFIRGASEAHWTKSAHNWNAALDLFNLDDEDNKNLYPTYFFKEVELELPDWVFWYGSPESKYKEKPHYELKNWHELTDSILKLIE